MYRQMTEDEARTSYSIMRAFNSRFGEEVTNIKVNERETLILSSKISLREVINFAFSNRELSMKKEPEASERIRDVATMLAKDIKDSWRPLESFNITKETMDGLIPDTLKQFLQDLGSNDEPAQIAIAQDIIGLTTRRTPPKHITLASSINHLTGSKQVINQLNKMGHCCSYTELMRLNTAMAMSEVQKGLEVGVIIPPNILPGRLGFIQAAADNDDFKVHTRDGSGSTHGTTMVLYQHQGSFSQVPFAPLTKSRQTSLKTADYKTLVELKVIQHQKKPDPPCIKETIALRKLQSEYLKMPHSMTEATNVDHAWILARLAPTKFFELDVNPSCQTSPSWSSFNARLHSESTPTIAVVGYCPMLNHSSTDPNTIYTVLSNINQMMDRLHQKHSVITFDLAIYRIAKEIQWGRKEEFKNTVIRMGGFHIITNYMAALGTMHTSSGLQQLTVESNIFSETTMKQIFSGKQYNRGVLAHKLFYETFTRKKLLTISEWLIFRDMEDPFIEIDLSENQDMQQLKQAAQILDPVITEFDNTRVESSMFKFWNNYLHAVQVLLCFIRAERTGDWELYMDSLIAMLPVMYAYDRSHYSRWLPIYIADMANLSDVAPEVYEEFLKGAFTINRSGKPFAGVPTDQVLEQTLNCDSKSPGGIVGISSDDDARNKWFLTSHIRAHLLSVQKELCSIRPSVMEKKHKEDNCYHTMKDEADIQSLLAVLDLYGVNPFSCTDLVNISTGAKPSKESADMITQALSIGAESAKSLIKERLEDFSKSFHAMIPKLNVPSFSQISKEKPKKGKAEKVKSRVPLAKLLILANTRDVDLRMILEYELGPVPLAMFDETRCMRKTTKSQLIQVFEQKYLAGDDTTYNNIASKALIIDAMSLVQTTKAKGLFKDFAKTLFERIMGMAKGYNRVDVVFDVYNANSIKSAERRRRGEQKMCSVKITNVNVPIPKKWDAFLSNIENKNELVRYLNTVWSTEFRQILEDDIMLFISGYEVLRLTKATSEVCSHLISNHDEADTRLVLHANDALETFDLVVIRSVDTDVVVIAAHHFKTMSANKPSKDILMLVGIGANQRYISLKRLCNNMPMQVLRNILPLHALTGCDSTSALFRISKKRALLTMETNDFDLSGLGPIDWSQLDHTVYQDVERFVARLYGEFNDVTEAKYRLLATKDMKSDAQLPPSKNALQYHIRRCSYQIALWKMALSAEVEVQAPCDHGWDQQLLPVICDPSSQENLTLLTSCRCIKSGCTRNTCKCKQMQLKCTDLCSCQGCQNMADDEESGSDDEYSSDES